MNQDAIESETFSFNSTDFNKNIVCLGITAIFMYNWLTGGFTDMSYW